MLVILMKLFENLELTASNLQRHASIFNIQKGILQKNSQLDPGAVLVDQENHFGKPLIAVE